MVFFGEYSVSFTGAGRIVLPKKIRDTIESQQFILAKGFDNCLHGFAVADWERRSQEFLNVSLLERENLEKRRFLFSSVSYIEADSQGRFVIPKSLLEYAHLQEEAVVVGAGDHFELWNPTTWTTYLAKLES